MIEDEQRAIDASIGRIVVINDTAYITKAGRTDCCDPTCCPLSGIETKCSDRFLQHVVVNAELFTAEGSLTGGGYICDRIKLERLS